MKTYNDKIAGNDKIELIMASDDRTEKAALAWAKKHGFKWPTVLRSNVKKAGLGKFEGEYVPQYVLVDKRGKVIVDDKKEVVFAKAMKLVK